MGTALAAVIELFGFSVNPCQAASTPQPMRETAPNSTARQTATACQRRIRRPATWMDICPLTLGGRDDRPAARPSRLRDHSPRSSLGCRACPDATLAAAQGRIPCHHVAAVLDLVRALAHRRAEPAHRLLLGRLVMYTGIAALFPVVPLYVRAHGGSAADIALFVAGPMVAATLIQIPAGHLVDRMGRKPTLVWSSVLYAVLCAGLFLDWGPLWLLALLRAGQGASGGAYGPALRAALADLTPADRRGHRYAQLQACEMGGGLVGPPPRGGTAPSGDSRAFA